MFSGENLFIPFKNSIINELKYFNILSSKAKNLLISYTLQGAAYPLTSTFINAYIWRTGENILSVAAYNVGNFISLPIFFYINGLFLKRINPQKLYFLGACLSAISAILVVFYKSFSPVNYLIYGLLYGVGFGFYWANRNYLTLKETMSENRNYFVGLNFAIDQTTSIVVPAVTGWFLVLGEGLNFYSTEQSYKLMVLIALILLFLSGLMVLKNNYERPQITEIFKFKISGRWNCVRLLTLAIGITEGLSYFIPTLIILTFLGNEAVLGSFDSIMAIVILLINYFYGRKAKVSHRIPVFWLGLFTGLLASLILLISQEKFAVIMFLALIYVAGSLTWVSIDPFFMDIIDKENGENKISDYTMVFDRELFLNIGRVLSVSLVASLLFFSNQYRVLTSTYVIAFIIEILLVSIFWKDLVIKTSKNPQI